MSLYEDHILPRLLNLAMKNKHLLPYRRNVIAGAEGRVLEVGIGSGLNLPFYTDRVTGIIGLEPSEKLAAMCERAGRKAAIPVTLETGAAEAMPFEDGAFDTVVTTWTLCTIPDTGRALAEMRRVLAPGGQLLFAEHGTAPEESVRRWQERLNPLWRKIAGGCNLNRPIGHLIGAGGFDIEDIETGYARGPRPLAFMYTGRARPA